jgi:hypothetical protein
MFRKLLFVAAAALTLAAFNVSAQADSVTISQGQSSTFTFQSANFAGSTATATFTLSGNQLIINFANTSTDNTFLSGIGFNSTPNLTITNATFTGDAAGRFEFATRGGGLGGFELRVSGNGNNNRLSPGESGTAILTFEGSFSSLTIDQIVAHLTSLPNGDSEKVPGNTEPIPEPATLLLLGTGIAGIAAKVRKRRRSEEKSTEI